MKKRNKTVNTKPTVQDVNDAKLPFMTRFICIFLSVIIVFGGVVGAMMIAKDLRAVAKYDGVVIEEGTCIYLASRYKALYLRELTRSGVAATDTERFWSSLDEEGVAWGERYAEGLKNYVGALLAAASLFNSYSRLTKEDKKCIADSIEEVLLYTAGGSKSKFNDLTEEYGFDFTDFEKGAELLYKAQRAQTIIYGADGSNLANFSSLCNEYLAEYTHVSLLFLRTDTKIVENEGGSLDIVDMTAEELANRTALIAKLRDHIAARQEEDTSRDWITADMFALQLKESDGDSDYYALGYYLHPSAEVTAAFSNDFPDVARVAFELEIGEYGEAEYDGGVCFVYRYDVAEGAYQNSQNAFFSDFYSDGADYHYARSLEMLLTKAEFTDAYYTLNLLAVPKNTTYYVKEWIS